MTAVREPASPRRRRTRALRTRTYLDAAMRVVAADGFDALTMQRLADELDQAVGTVYRYFPGKDALVAALQREAIDVLLAAYEESRGRLESHLARRDEATVAVARAVHFGCFVAAAADVLPEQTRLLQLLVADPRAIVPDDQVEVVAPAGAAVLAAASTALEGALPRQSGQRSTGTDAVGTGDTAGRAAVMWVASLLGVVATRKLSRLDPGLFDSSSLAADLTETLLLGWGVERGRLRRAVAAVDAFAAQGPLVIPPEQQA